MPRTATAPQTAPETDAGADAKETAKAKAKAKREALVSFRGEGAPKLTEPVTPEGFISSKHRPLAKSDFESEDIFLDWRANEYDRKAANYRKEAEDYRKLGSATDRKKAKKLMDMQQRMADLARELSEDGSVDLENLLGADQLAALMNAGE